MSKFVRLKRFNGKQHVLQRYTVFGIKFEESKGWYEVDDDVAAYLKTVKQVQDSPDAEFSADAFDVVDTLEQARELDEKERKKAERKKAEDAERVRRPQAVQARGAGRGRPSAGDLTTEDLNQPVRPRKGDSFDDQDDTFPEGDEPINPGPNVSPKVTVESEESTVDDLLDEPAAKPSTAPAKSGKKK